MDEEERLHREELVSQMIRIIDPMMELVDTVDEYGIGSLEEAAFVRDKLDGGMQLLDRLVRIIVTVHHASKDCPSGRLKPIILAEDYDEFMDNYRGAVIEYNRYRSSLT